MKLSFKALAKILSAVVVAAFSLLILYKMFGDEALINGYGLPGVFIAALLSHLSIVARGMFLPALLALTEVYNPALLGFVAGLGGALGEVTAYYWGSGIRDAIEGGSAGSSPSKPLERYGLLLMLLFASSPLPDTPIVLLAGSLRFPLSKIVLIQVVGKSVLYLMGAYVGGFVFMELKSALGYEATSALLLAASLALCILVSWKRSRDKILELVNRVLTYCFRLHRK